VRFIRAATPEGGTRLLIYGPGNAQTTHEFQDDSSCTTLQSELERQLVALGFALEQFTDRRGGIERRTVPRDTVDRRRE
jgi:hypothetical protein